MTRVALRCALALVSALVGVLPVASARAAGRGASAVRALPALHAVPDVDEGGRIVDVSGREVLLRGVNVNAFVQYWRYGTRPATAPLTDADVDGIADVGWNSVRLLLSWSRIEPRPGRYDERYLDRVASAVARFAGRGIYTILDFHQDAWGPSLAAPAGTTCPAGSLPAFGWDGAPRWATLAGDAPRCAPGGVRELSPAVQAAFAAFWRDDAGPGGVGIQTRYLRMLEHVAERFAPATAVAGFDVMNEPNAFAPSDVAALGRFERDAVRAIRRGERDGERRARSARRHLVFVEPAITWSASGAGTPALDTTNRGLVFAPHLYEGAFDGGPVTRSIFERARADAASLGGVPVLVGEWGTDPARADDPTDDYFVEHQRLQDEFRFSATLWTWRESCGDPHKAAEVRAGKVPVVWGELDVDCSTGRTRGPRRHLLQQLARAYVRAAPGRLQTLAYEPGRDALDASGTAAARGELVAWSPRRVRAADVTGRDLTRIRVQSRDGRRGVEVHATVRPGRWQLRVDGAG